MTKIEICKDTVTNTYTLEVDGEVLWECCSREELLELTLKDIERYVEEAKEF